MKKIIKKEKILIVVDVQNGFMVNQGYIDIANKIEQYIINHQNDYTHIFFTKFINSEDSLYQTKLNWHRLTDKTDTDFVFPLPINSKVITKNTYGLSAQDLRKIKSLKPNQVDICGLQTDACVYAISFQLFDSGIFPNILINYCATDESRKEFAKQSLKHQFGKLDERE